VCVGGSEIFIESGCVVVVSLEKIFSYRSLAVIGWLVDIIRWMECSVENISLPKMVL